MFSQFEELSLIDSVDEVISNVKRFNNDLDSCELIISRLSSFRHWYYIEEFDLFGPSKFIGYKNNTAEEYKKGTLGEYCYMNGTETQPILSKLFEDIYNVDTDKAYILHEKLESFLGNYDKKPNKRAIIYIKK